MEPTIAPTYHPGVFVQNRNFCFNDRLASWSATKAVAWIARFWHHSLLSLATYLVIVASVSLYDIWLTIEYAPSLPQLETNPIGRWLMNLDYCSRNSHFGTTPDVTLFVSLKALGTCLVVGILAILHTTKRRIGHPVSLGVAAFQLGLAYHLTYFEQ